MIGAGSLPLGDRPMKKFLRQQFARAALAFALTWCICSIMWQSELTLAATPLSKQKPIEVTMDLGMSTGELQFQPDRLKFRAGQRYQLLLKNPSPLKHYFTAKDFADAIWSQKVDAGNVEIKGAIHELELRPGTSAAWVFIPVRAGVYPLRCTVAGHAEAGMTGTLEITG
jgi:uncharacterized cupredoxin-like copper-binding protein